MLVLSKYKYQESHLISMEFYCPIPQDSVIPRQILTLNTYPFNLLNHMVMFEHVQYVR